MQIRIGRLRLAERCDLVDLADEEHPALVDGRVTQAVLVSCPMYFFQIPFSCSVTQAPSFGSSSRISRSTVTFRLIQWYMFSGFMRRIVILGVRRIQEVFLRCCATFTSTLSSL